jgi:hypothetical protein
VVTSLRKKRVEVNEKRLRAEEREMMNAAKGQEIREFLEEAVVTRLQNGEYIDPAEVMKMRWVLTWKKDEQNPGKQKAKARLVVLGFQDPYLGKENTNSPTLHRRSKQILLQIATQRGWTLHKGDVTAAFLQGKSLSVNKYAIAHRS